jgi:hypothetical protein
MMRLGLLASAGTRRTVEASYRLAYANTNGGYLQVPEVADLAVLPGTARTRGIR